MMMYYFNVLNAACYLACAMLHRHHVVDPEDIDYERELGKPKYKYPLSVPELNAGMCIMFFFLYFNFSDIYHGHIHFYILCYCYSLKSPNCYIVYILTSKTCTYSYL